MGEKRGRDRNEDGNKARQQRTKICSNSWPTTQLQMLQPSDQSVHQEVFQPNLHIYWLNDPINYISTLGPETLLSIRLPSPPSGE